MRRGSRACGHGSHTDTLLQLKQPFVFVAGGAGGGKLSVELAEKVKASGTGLYHLGRPHTTHSRHFTKCSGWFDQISLLSHPATGWLMCHAGWNSICEALVRGVPLITWPFLADQPVNAALVSTGTPQLGFELLEVRTNGRNQSKQLTPGPPGHRAQAR